MSPRSNQKTRAGIYVDHLDGYKFFVPNPLPPSPNVEMDYSMADLLSKANRAIGRLDGSADILPNPNLFVAGYVRKEALLSSQIEGTQASLEDVLAYEAVTDRRKQHLEVGEVVNYVKAINHGLSMLSASPINNELLLDLHTILLKAVRGKDRSPGRFRQHQNWIGPMGADIYAATFIPPPASEVPNAMSALEDYITHERNTPTLIKCALVHAQFETIHPFLDGNGRLGRLLMILILCKEGTLKRPILYLSAYYKEHRDEYYSLLQNVRDRGDWENWINFFLKGVWLASEEAFETAKEIISMREKHRLQILEKARSPTKGFLLLDYLYENPAVSISEVAELLKFSYQGASKLVDDLYSLDLLEEMTGQQRNRLFRYKPYLDLLRKGTEPVEYIEE